MATFRHMGTLQAGTAVFSRGITDLALVRSAAGLTLVSATHVGGGMASWQLASSAAAGRAVDTEGYAGLGRIVDPRAIVIGGAVHAFGLSGAVGGGKAIGADGSLSAPAKAPAAGLPWDTLTAVEVPGTGLVLAARNDAAVFTGYRPSADGLAAAGRSAVPFPVPAGARIDDLATVSVGGATWALAISTGGGFLAVQRLNADGTLGEARYVGMSPQTPFRLPTEVEAVTVAGGTYVIVAGSGSHSLTVLKMAANGALTPVDHILDAGATRFASVAEMAAVTLSGRSYVIVGGADDGLSLFTILPDGRLVLLDTVEDTARLSLQNVSALTAAALGGRIVVAAASETEPGVSQFEIDPGPIGATGWAGTGDVTGTGANDMLMAQDATTVIRGGGGDDILASGRRAVTLVGGAGRDVFIPSAMTATVTIADFNPAEDRIDLSNLGYLRSAQQLAVTATARGLSIRYGTTTIAVQSHDGTTLGPGIITDALFPIAHYPAGGGSETIIGTPAGDRISGLINGLQAYGLDGSDTITGSYLADNLNGGTHDDRLYGRGGGDSLFGGSGNDVGYGEGGDDSLTGAEGADALFGGPGADRLSGSAGNDTLDGGTDADRATGDAGNDRLSGGEGNDTLHGGLGNDTLGGQDGDDLLVEAQGLNLLSGGAGRDTLIGGTDADRLYGEDGDDILLALGGDDRMWGQAGEDTLQGGEGNDTLLGGLGNDRLIGGPGADILDGEAGDDVIFAGAENDHVSGREGDDILYGDWGDDTLLGQEGNDLIAGGAGNDSLLSGGGTDRLYGGDGNDTITGGVGQQLLYGGAGNDLIFGAASADSIHGEGGDDVIYALGGDDLVIGGAGLDTLRGGEGHDSLQGWDGNDRLLGEAGFDRLEGGGGDDLIHGGDGNDVLAGDAGADALLGGNGEDILRGGDGLDQLWGEAGGDLLEGGAGRDSLRGGPGADRLAGGADADVFIFAAASDSRAGGMDVIVDFTRGLDRIDLRGMHLAFVGQAGFSGHQGEVRVQAVAGGCQLQADLNGDRLADLLIALTGPLPGAGDLLL